MSIAISAVVKPSRSLLVIVSGMSVGIIVAAGMIASGTVGELSLYSRLVVVVLCVLAAIVGFFQTYRKRKTFHIDISGIGQIRLSEYNGIVTFPAFDGQRESESCVEGELVKLMADSTIWPHFLLLRLQGEGGRITAIPILADCMAEDSFRAISVACRWIAAQNTRAKGELI
jgi:toxin CptA